MLPGSLILLLGKARFQMYLSRQCISSSSFQYTYFAEGSLSLTCISCQSLGLNINLPLPHSWKVHTIKTFYRKPIQFLTAIQHQQTGPIKIFLFVC